MTVVYVDSDEPGAGKTAICASLVFDLKERGIRAIAFKPLSNGRDPNLDSDADVLSRLLDQPKQDKRTPAPKTRLSPGRLQETIQRTREALSGNEILVMEGASDMSPQGTSQLVRALDARLLLVARYRSGLDISDMSSWSRRYGERLLGVVVNGVTRYKGKELTTCVLPSLTGEGLTFLGSVPEVRHLLASTVGEVASHLNGRFLSGEEFADRLVENFLVGGMGLDSGELYFGLRDTKAVIVRGDRPDIQMAALATPTACMLVTQGKEPIEYVRNEAMLEEVPIIVVDSDTLSTMDALNTLPHQARFNHPDKQRRFAGLLRESVGLDELYASLGIAT